MNTTTLICSGCLSTDDPTTRSRRYVHAEYEVSGAVVWCDNCATESARDGYTFPEATTSTEDDFTDPTFVLGAVLAQMEDLSEADKMDVLCAAIASLKMSEVIR